MVGWSEPLKTNSQKWVVQAQWNRAAYLISPPLHSHRAWSQLSTLLSFILAFTVIWMVRAGKRHSLSIQSSLSSKALIILRNLLVETSPQPEISISIYPTCWNHSWPKRTDHSTTWSEKSCQKKYWQGYGGLIANRSGSNVEKLSISHLASSL